MKKKFNKIISKPVEVEAKPIESVDPIKSVDSIKSVDPVKPEPTILEITDKSSIDGFVKQGFVVTEIRSEKKGISLKTWILKKEAL